MATDRFVGPIGTLNSLMLLSKLRAPTPELDSGIVSYRYSDISEAWRVEALDETERFGCYPRFMAIYLCRWPNGEFSVVSAKTKSDAIELLDEWGNAEQAFLTRMRDCMFDFRLDDDGQIELANIGEATHDHIMETCYPELDKALVTAEWDEAGEGYSAKGREYIREAVVLERTRLWHSHPRGKEAETELGRQIQRQTGAPSVVVDRIVREAAKRRLQSKEGEGKKPN